MGGEGSQQGPVCSLLPRLSYFVWQEGGGHLNREATHSSSSVRGEHLQREGTLQAHTELREAILQQQSKRRSPEDKQATLAPADGHTPAAV